MQRRGRSEKNVNRDPAGKDRSENENNNTKNKNKEHTEKLTFGGGKGSTPPQR
jgi:hypothetical protein